MIKSISVSRQFAPLRVCGEMCLYYYVLAVLSLSVKYNVSTELGVYGVVSNIIAPWLTTLLILVGTCFAMGFVIVRINNTALRFLLSLLPGLSFFISPLEQTMLIHAAAWVYYVIYMTVGNFELYVDVYRRRARLLFIIALIMTCLLVIYHFGNEAWYGNTLFGGEVFGLLFFILIVFSLRGMRLSSGAPAKMRVFDAVHVVALPALLIAAFFFLRGAIPAFTWIIARITRACTWLFRLLFGPKDMPKPYTYDEDFNAPTSEDPVELPNTQTQAPDTGQISGTDPHISISDNAWMWILIAILAAALVYLAIRLIRSNRKEVEKPKLVREHIEKVPREKRSRRKSGELSLSANVNKVRKIYRSYLEHIRSSGIKIFPSDASEDVLENVSARLELPENSALRELYIAARYGDPNTVTSEQAAEAKRCMTVIQNNDLAGGK